MFQLFRLRVLVEPEDRIELNPQQAALIYATLANAYSISCECDPVLPDGVMVEAPEQGRIRVEAGDQLAFGWTLISGRNEDALFRCHHLVEGLRRLGARARNRSQPLGGGFQVRSVEDVIADQPWQPGQPLASLSHQDLVPFVAELAQSLTHEPLRIRLSTPMRMSRPKSQRHGGHSFFDSAWFDPNVWLNRLRTRLNGLGLAAICPDSSQVASQRALPVNSQEANDATTTDRTGSANADDLVWVDIPYKGTGGEKSLGGVVGQVDLGHVDPDWAGALVWCQMLGVGESTRMGLGRYQVLNLLANHRSQPNIQSTRSASDPDQTATTCSSNQTCTSTRWFGHLPRWKSLVDLALTPTAIDRGAAQYQLPAGATVPVVDAIRSGLYRPDPTHRFELRDGDKRPRAMCVPSRRDRAIQQAILQTIAPTLDRYFESSSFAFRKGLGRHSAAKHVEQVSKQGYVWAARSDIHRFFDQVDHSLIESRLRAYLPDEPLIELLMCWVRASTSNDPGKAHDRGLPTGAPISPVIANLLLDQFDEHVERDGGKLVRYADDFLILHRSEAEVKQALQVAQAAAEQLRLELSEPKTSLHAPDDSFNFLGFRFSRDSQWRYSTLLPPTTLPGLGWVDLSSPAAKRDADELQLPLPGEVSQSLDSHDSIAVLSSRVSSIRGRSGKLILLDRSDQTLKQLACRRLSFILAQGTPNIAASAWKELIEHQVDVMMIGPSGRPRCQIRTRPQSTSAAARLGQMQWAGDPARSLPVARLLIHAKLHNTATACRTLFKDQQGVAISEQLIQLSRAALSAGDHASLMGYEGLGAAEWFALYGSRLPKPFRFDRREAPRSRTPGNVLLNIVYSHLYRLSEAAAMAAGLMPELGVLHQERSGHLALASDLQEPFRHLGDRAVLLAAQRMSASDFKEVTNAEYPLTIQPPAMRRLFEVLYRTLSTGCIDDLGRRGSYRDHLFKQARSIRRCLIESQQKFEPFKHP